MSGAYAALEGRVASYSGPVVAMGVKLYGNSFQFAELIAKCRMCSVRSAGLGSGGMRDAARGGA